jgi:phosphatidylserine/phosphatidylglycerophosphate/cardiolipin synthase-like enzyme
MDRAESAIMFLVFMPGRSGVNNIVGRAADIAQTDTPGGADGDSARLTRKLQSLEKADKFVMGAISDPSALPDYKAPPKTSGQKKGTIKPPPPAIWWPGGDKSKIAIIRAAAVRIPFGNLRPELLTAGHAIIHDKIIVIDPLDKTNCTVITGSHNLGYKASYCNDENLLIIQGNRELAISYAVHVIDLYDHYLMRARLEERIRSEIEVGTLKSYDDAAAQSAPRGLLPVRDGWQDTRLPARHSSSMAYFLDNA